MKTPQTGICCEQLTSYSSSSDSSFFVVGTSSIVTRFSVFLPFGRPAFRLGFTFGFLLGFAPAALAGRPLLPGVLVILTSGSSSEEWAASDASASNSSSLALLKLPESDIFLSQLPRFPWIWKFIIFLVFVGFDFTFVILAVQLIRFWTVFSKTGKLLRVKWFGRLKCNLGHAVNYFLQFVYMVSLWSHFSLNTFPICNTTRIGYPTNIFQTFNGFSEFKFFIYIWLCMCAPTIDRNIE